MAIRCSQSKKDLVPVPLACCPQKTVYLNKLEYTVQTFYCTILQKWLLFIHNFYRNTQKSNHILMPDWVCFQCVLGLKVYLHQQANLKYCIWHHDNKLLHWQSQQGSKIIPCGNEWNLISPTCVSQQVAEHMIYFICDLHNLTLIETPRAAGTPLKNSFQSLCTSNDMLAS